MVKKKQKVDYIGVAKKKVGEWLYNVDTLDELKKDIRDFSSEPKQYYDYFVKKYDEMDKSGKNYKSIESLQATIRRTYNYLSDSKKQIDIKRSKQIEEAYKVHYWDLDIVSKYSNHFKNEKKLGSKKTHAILGYYKDCKDSDLWEFLENDFVKYTSDSKNLLYDLQKYFKCKFLDSSYVYELDTLSFIKIRVFMRFLDKTQPKGYVEKVYHSGYLNVDNFQEEFIIKFEKYYRRWANTKFDYEDINEKWFVPFISIQSAFFDENEFQREKNKKKSIYLYYL